MSGKNWTTEWKRLYNGSNKILTGQKWEQQTTSIYGNADKQAAAKKNARKLKMIRLFERQGETLSKEEQSVCRKESQRQGRCTMSRAA